MVDVRIKRLNLPEQNKQSVYARMRAERERIARQYRAEGEEQALGIRADADQQREEILSVAYKEAEKTKGEGDAESTRIYGQAYSRNPRFYKLLRTLEAYKKILDDKTTAILSSDSELLRILTKRPERSAMSTILDPITVAPAEEHTPSGHKMAERRRAAVWRPCGCSPASIWWLRISRPW